MNLQENAVTVKKKINERYYDIDKLVSTTDYWCPNYPDDKIKVSMFMYDYDDEITVKVTAYGMDDTVYGLVYTTVDDMDGCYMADRVWNLWKVNIYDKVPEGVDIDWFLDRGFLWG